MKFEVEYEHILKEFKLWDKTSLHYVKIVGHFKDLNKLRKAAEKHKNNIDIAEITTKALNFKYGD